MVVHGRPGFRLTQSEESGVGLNGAYLSNHSIIYLKYVLAKDKRYRDSRRALIRPKEDYGLIGGPDSDGRTWPTRFQTHAERRIGSGFEWRLPSAADLINYF